MLALSILIEVARHFESTQIGKLVIFLQCVKKKVSKLILCSTVMQNIQIFYRGPVMFVVTCSLLSSMLMYHNFQEKLKKHYEKCTLNVLAISENSAENHKVMTAQLHRTKHQTTQEAVQGVFLEVSEVSLTSEAVACSQIFFKICS